MYWASAVAAALLVSAAAAPRGNAPVQWPSLATANGASLASALARTSAACDAGALGPAPPDTAALLLAVPARSDGQHDAALSLLACAVRRELVSLTTAEIAEALLVACARKSAKLVVALLQHPRGGGALAGLRSGSRPESRLGGATGATAAVRGWGPLHAALSTQLLVLSLAQDVLKERPDTPAAAYAASLASLVAALTRHAAAPAAGALADAAAALGLPAAGGGAAAAAIAADGTAAVALSRALRTTVAAGSLNAIANALATQIVRLVLAVTSPQPAGGDGDDGGARAAGLATAVDAFGRTPLHIAAASGNDAAVAALLSTVARAAVGGGELDGGASRTAAFAALRDANGRSALHEACGAGHAVTAAILERAASAAVGGSSADTGAAACGRLAASAVPQLAGSAGADGGGWDDAGAEDTGGWDVLPPPAPASDAARALAALAPHPCDVDTLPASELSPARFAEYLLAGRPLRVTRAVEPRLRAALRRASLLERAGALPFAPAAIPYAKAFSGEAPAMTLREYDAWLRECSGDGGGGGKDGESHCSSGDAAARGALYVFEASAGGSERELQLLGGLTHAELLPHFVRNASVAQCAGKEVSSPCSDTRRVPLLPFGDSDGHDSTNSTAATASAPRLQFYVGGSGSGAPWHFHKDAVNLLAYGAKRWLLAPPALARYSTQPIASWVLEHGAVGDGVLVCDQHASDALYVPRGWGHAVLNTAPAVGVAVEFGVALDTSL